MALMKADLKNGKWNKLIIECEGIDPSMDNSYISIWANLALKLHEFTPIKDIKFKNQWLEIEFVDGRIWKSKIWSQTINTDISYDLDKDTKWSRESVLAYLSPLVTATVTLYANYGLNDIKGIPKS